MTCEEYQGALLAGELDERGSAHVSGCPACRSASPSLERLRRRLRDPLLWEEPPASLAERTVAAVAEERLPEHGRRRRRLPVVAGVAVLALIGALAVALGLRDTPDWEVVLVPGRGWPMASGAVAGWNMESGTRMQLDVAGIGPSGGDAYYEIWLTDPDGRHVSAGTFRGPGTVTAWAGVARAEFPRIWITLEPADDDPTPSSDVVLDTDV